MNEYEEKYIYKLKWIKKEYSNLYSYLAKNILNKIGNKSKIISATHLAQELNISNALISKFTRMMGYQAFNNIIFIHNNCINKTKQNKSSIINKTHVLASQMIISARKIMFLGVSTSLFTNKDFANKLMRLDKWVLIPEHKYEQIGLSKLLFASDLLIVNSVSLQHEWMSEIIQNTKAKVILISANLFQSHKLNVNLFINVEHSSDDSTEWRIFTTNIRRNVLKEYDKIFEQLLNHLENRQLLKLTSYKKNS